MNWYYDEPTDKTAQWNRRVVWTEQQIVNFYKHKKGLPRADRLTDEELIDDFVVVNWASKTDMPAGEYITKSISN